VGKQNRDIDPVSFCLILISAIKPSECTPASSNLQAREILENTQKEETGKWK